MSNKAKIAELTEKLEKAMVLISEQSAIIASQSAELERLNLLVSALSVKKSSKNSHLSPSSDIARKNESLREKSENPIGGQKGHDGNTLKMTSTPDVIKELVPSYCNDCGLPLAGLAKELVSSRQVIDIPPIQPITTEYQSFSVKCSCGHRQVGKFPSGVNSHIQYGENIQSMAVYQSIYQYLPFKRLQDFFKKIVGVELCQGTLENMLRRTAEKAAGIYETLRVIIAVSFFVGSDETSGKSSKSKSKIWFWVWQNAIVTYIVAAFSRSKQVILDTFPDGLPNTILCSDRLAAQLSTVTKGTQICLVHLLRDLNYLIELEKTPWATAFKNLLKDAMALKKIQTHYHPDDPKVKDIEQRADKLLQLSFEELEWTKKEQHKTMTFFKGMLKLRQALFPFLYHAEVPPDNNGSERAIRLVKVKTKISGHFKSLQQPFAVLRSVIDSAVKNGQPVFDAIKAVVNIPLSSK